MEQLNKYLALQYREIEEHKYYLSEQAQKNVGIEYTLMNWYLKGHAERFNRNYFSNKENIESICNKCGYDCDGVKRFCIMDTTLIHIMLKDNNGK